MKQRIFYNFGFVYPINVKTAEPIGPKFCVATQRDGSSMVKVKYFTWKNVNILDFRKLSNFTENPLSFKFYNFEEEMAA